MPETGRPKVLLVESLYHPDGEALLAEHADVITASDATDEELAIAIRDAHAALVRYPARLGREVIREARNLLVISTSGRGTDAIDIAEATERGIAVVNNPGLGRVPVSEHTLALILDLAKEVTRDDRRVRAGVGWEDRHESQRFELEERTLGIIGLGSIGREVARKCRAAFNMRVIAYDPYVEPATVAPLGIELVETLDELLTASAVVTCHAELTPETRGMLGEAQLRRMRPEAILVNTARGPIVQPDALALALREGWIRGAALDVFAVEPPGPDNPLYALDNLVLTPHTAGLTAEARRELALSAATQVLQVLRGERPRALVNPIVWDEVRERRPTTY
ncbi:MAG: D-3-phosphoglycerate dehydrogenase [uncultured Thermomicrobiales bacterium]|uniref:D-3-phosphoglycerate dehydrogenase n=1 Tax=uncultured Thermomicrobiales bacterium TaxID=1645740 RepID=A0A6J4VRR5_9BACT|nr:MAG: D-3-phosphoglycerate dehydrogenase [uncultured Thermomicrobiales bacterium]